MADPDLGSEVPNLCTTVAFSWRGVRWVVDYVATPDGDQFRGNSTIVSAVRENEPDARKAALTSDDVRNLLQAYPGQFERKAAHWARRGLFGHASELVRIPPHPHDPPHPKNP